MSILIPNIEWLDSAKMLQVVSPVNQQLLAKIEIFKTLDSTNTYLLEQAKIGASSGTFCFAEQQTNGRGRRGRVWHSPLGANIYGSLLWRLPVNVNVSGLSLAVAVMVANALKKYGMPTVQLKWPNDLWFLERKLAGILIERMGDAVVIGVGLNVNLPVTREENWIAVHEIVKQPLGRNTLVGFLINELLTQLVVYENKGFKAFITAWREHDILLNREVSLHAPSSIYHGVMRGVNEQGELLLENAEGKLHVFSYGEISVRF